MACCAALAGFIALWLAAKKVVTGNNAIIAPDARAWFLSPTMEQDNR